MASTIAAVTTSGGGVVTTADASGNLNLLAGTTTVVALTTAGAAVSGTLSATGITTVAAGSAALPAIVSTTGTADTGIWFPAADTVAASTAGTERLRIDSSGNVGIGTSSLSYKLEVNGTINIANGSSVGWGNQQTTITGSTATNVMQFYTAAVERMRIDASGNLLLNQTSGNADAKFSVNAGSTDASPCIDFRKGSATTTTAQVFTRFFTSAGAVATGSITANGVSSATFTAYSDKRLKENIVDLPSQLSNIMALRPVEFDFKGYENGEGHQLGFIAQEVQEIYPDLIGEGTDGMLTLSDMNKNDARLIKCIQELKAIIDTQATRIAALEAK